MNLHFVQQIDGLHATVVGMRRFHNFMRHDWEYEKKKTNATLHTLIRMCAAQTRLRTYNDLQSSIYISAALPLPPMSTGRGSRYVFLHISNALICRRRSPLCMQKVNCHNSHTLCTFMVNYDGVTVVRIAKNSHDG